MTFLVQVLAILWKDIRCELRSKQTWTSMGLFALLVLVIFNFAFDLRVDNKAAIAPGALEVVALPVFAALFNVPLFAGALLPIVLLGTLGVATIGTLFSAIAAATHARELLLPILVFPLIVPVVIGAVRATGTLMVPAVNEPPWLGLMAAFDVIFLSVSMLMFEYVIEE